MRYLALNSGGLDKLLKGGEDRHGCGDHDPQADGLGLDAGAQPQVEVVERHAQVLPRHQLLHDVRPRRIGVRLGLFRWHAMVSEMASVTQAVKGDRHLAVSVSGENSVSSTLGV